MTEFDPYPHLQGDALEIQDIRAQGAGGQNVNKVSSAVHLRFDIRASGLPEAVKRRLLALSDRRVNRRGILVIKAQNERSRERNLAAARERLADLIQEAAQVPKRRIPTRPGQGARRRRRDAKIHRGRIKGLRRRPEPGE